MQTTHQECQFGAIKEKEETKPLKFLWKVFSLLFNKEIHCKKKEKVTREIFCSSLVLKEHTVPGD